jgi:hypothetical protein
VDLIRNAVLVALLGLGLAGCGGDSAGKRCATASDCDDGQICAALATCAGGSCPSICGHPCGTSDECAEGEICAETSAVDARICQRSRTIDDL